VRRLAAAVFLAAAAAACGDGPAAAPTQPAVAALVESTSIEIPRASDQRMNSWRCSSVMSPVAVSVAIAVRHSSSVSPTSATNACRWRTSACITSRRRGSWQPAKLASTAAVMSAGVVRSAAVSGGVMRRFCRSAPRPVRAPASAPGPHRAWPFAPRVADRT